MYCTNCRHFIPASCKFCANCGMRVAVPENRAVFATDEIPLPDNPPEFRKFPDPPTDYDSDFDESPKEKVFFGKGAFSFCLTVIAVLSVTAAMFIGLYFNERDRNSADSRGRTSSGYMSVLCDVDKSKIR